jgi:predicted nucleic acid-binding protein
MTRAVVDASVALKWFIGARPGEDDVDAAMGLLSAVADGQVELIQPPHFVAEVAAVLVRETPATAQRDLSDLLDLRMRIDAASGDYALAMTLAERHRQHLFDTLYHALALRTDHATLVTADERYVRKAIPEGRIVRLRDFRRPS